MARKEPKISMDLVNELRRQGQLEKFMKIYTKIHEGKDRKYANTILGCLEIAHSFNKKREPYLIIGGISVMTHLEQSDPEYIFKWRGTDDIDLLANKKKASGILMGADYKLKQPINNKKGAIGPVYVYAKEDNGETTVVGLRKGISLNKKDITRKLLENSTVGGLFSIPIRIPPVEDLVSLKRAANRSKDREDIRALKEFYKI